MRVLVVLAIVTAVFWLGVHFTDDTPWWRRPHR